MGLYLRQMPLGPMENFVYLVGDTVARKAWVVDPAWDVDAILDQARKDGMSLEGALITHAHFDHVNGVQALLTHKDMPVYVQSREMDFLGRGAPRGLFLDLPPEHVRLVQPGDTLNAGGTKLTFLHTPGHTPGSQCFLVEGNILAGDTLFLGACGRCDMPGGNPHEMFDTLNNVLARLPENTILYPGHHYSQRGVSATLKEEKVHNRFFNAHTMEEFFEMAGLQ
jgi:glyoxylase-like metal-dependent hydrolase (beta-lactamase superfamily II)